MDFLDEMVSSISETLKAEFTANIANLTFADQHEACNIDNERVELRLLDLDYACCFNVDVHKSFAVSFSRISSSPWEILGKRSGNGRRGSKDRQGNEDRQEERKRGKRVNPSWAENHHDGILISNYWQSEIYLDGVGCIWNVFRILVLVLDILSGHRCDFLAHWGFDIHVCAFHWRASCLFFCSTCACASFVSLTKSISFNCATLTCDSFSRVGMIRNFLYLFHSMMNMNGFGRLQIRCDGYVAVFLNSALFKLWHEIGHISVSHLTRWFTCIKCQRVPSCIK